MKRVYKYPVPTTAAKFTLQLPLDADIIRIDWQNDKLCLWAVCDPDAQLVTRKFRLYGTGQDIDKDCLYIDTYYHGPLVLHIFEDYSQ